MSILDTIKNKYEEFLKAEKEFEAMVADSKVFGIILLIFIALIYVYNILGEIENIKDSIKKGEEPQMSPNMVLIIISTALGLAIIINNKSIIF